LAVPNREYLYVSFYTRKQRNSKDYLHILGLENSVAPFLMQHLETGSKKFKIAAIHQRVYHACNSDKGIQHSIVSHMCHFPSDIEPFGGVIEFPDHENTMNVFLFCIEAEINMYFLFGSCHLKILTSGFKIVRNQ
jgi:hypothetical protein